MKNLLFLLLKENTLLLLENNEQIVWKGTCRPNGEYESI